MILFGNKIPSSHIFTKRATDDSLMETIASKVAVVLVHEAAHKKSWGEKFALHNQGLAQSFNSNVEEGYADKYEQMAESRLDTQLNPNLLWEKGPGGFEGAAISPTAVLNRAVQIANSLGVLPYTIHSGAVEARDLGSQRAWGMFEMVQSPDMPNYDGVSMAWDDDSKKLLIDVNSIIRYYSHNVEAIKSDYQRYADEIAKIKEQNKNGLMTRQYDGAEPDVPGVSMDSPLNVATPTGSVPSVGAAPSKGPVPSR